MDLPNEALPYSQTFLQTSPSIAGQRNLTIVVFYAQPEPDQVQLTWTDCLEVIIPSIATGMVSLRYEGVEGYRWSDVGGVNFEIHGENSFQLKAEGVVEEYWVVVEVTTPTSACNSTFGFVPHTEISTVFFGDCDYTRVLSVEIHYQIPYASFPFRILEFGLQWIPPPVPIVIDSFVTPDVVRGEEQKSGVEGPGIAGGYRHVSVTGGEVMISGGKLEWNVPDVIDSASLELEFLGYGLGTKSFFSLEGGDHFVIQGEISQDVTVMVVIRSNGYLCLTVTNFRAGQNVFELRLSHFGETLTYPCNMSKFDGISIDRLAFTFEAEANTAIELDSITFEKSISEPTQETWSSTTWIGYSTHFARSPESGSETTSSSGDSFWVNWLIFVSFGAALGCFLGIVTVAVGLIRNRIKKRRRNHVEQETYEPEVEDEEQ